MKALIVGMTGEEVGTLIGTEVSMSARRFGSTEGYSSVMFAVGIVSGAGVPGVG
jgi:hypothetical protein